MYSKEKDNQVSSDDDTKSTDTSGASGPEQVADSSSDDSDSECDTDVMPNSEFSDAETDSDSMCSSALEFQRMRVKRLRHRVRRRRMAKRLKPHLMHSSQEADATTPISGVISALDAWLASKTEENSVQCQPIPSSSEGEDESRKLDGLQDAMSKLAPHEVALMKAMLDVKLASQ
jgi:hypothetical protein